MATITASTGTLDVNSLVTQLMTIERAPIEKLDRTRSGVQTKLSAVGQIQGALSSLQDAARALTSLTTWQAAKASSADETTVLASASSGAPKGNYSVRVDQLAQRQSVSGPALAAPTTVVGGGILTIQMGSAAPSGPGFTPDPARAALNLTVPDGSTLTDLVSQINAAEAGITAAMVKDGSTYRLLLRSTDSGIANAFRITASDSDGNSTDANGLSMAIIDPAAPTAAAATLNESSRDAEFVFGGMELTSSNNKIESVVENTTIELRKVNASPVDVNVVVDEAAIRAAVDKFVSAYNELNKQISTHTRYDAATRTSGTLQGNRAILTVQSQMRELVGSRMTTGSLGRLSDAGLQIQRDGSLSVDASTFTQALANPNNLRTLFAHSDTVTPANSGIATRLVSLATAMLGTEGVITNSSETFRKRITDIDSQKDRLESRMTDIERRLRSTYSALDARLSRMSSIGQSLDSIAS